MRKQLLAASLACAFIALTFAPVPSVVGQSTELTDTFGYGAPRFVQFDAPNTLPDWDNAGEPTIGIPHNTDSIFYQSAESTYRIRFADDGTSTWEDVSNTFAGLENVDPMLHADPVTGRIWAGGLQGPCSFMGYSDDDGETWSPTGNMCSGAQFDHQSIGSGPWAESLLPVDSAYPHATYYCAQAIRTACTTSFDGGVTWQPMNQVLGACGGLHGHIRVSPVTGAAVVPHKNCGGQPGMAITTDNGLTWNSRLVPDGASSGSFDSSAQFTEDAGWLYYGYADENGAFLGLSKDEGQSWETIGTRSSPEPAEWLDVGRLHDPPVVIGTFADVQAGDDDRVAYAFLGVEDSDGDGLADEYPEDPFHTCHPPAVDKTQLIWYYYVATSYDAGQSWKVTKVSEDPVQVGGIWMGQTTGVAELCRNILDFNDMDMDSTGRLVIAFADGCVAACVTNPETARGNDAGPDDDAEGFRTDRAAIIRQVGGHGLRAEFDRPGSNPFADQDGDGIPDDQDDDIDGDGILNDADDNPFEANTKKTPALQTSLLGLALVGLALVLRRRA